MTADFAPHNMTANNVPSPFVASASTEVGTNYRAYKAFDGVVGSQQYWAATTIAAWLKLFVQDAYTLVNYTVRANSYPEPTREPKAWTMEGSIDGTNWDVLDTVTNQTAWGSGESRNFVCAVQGNYYTYFRINITENNGSTGTAVGELYLYGDAGTASTKNYLKDRIHSRIDLSPISLG